MIQTVDALESASSVIMANGVNATDSFSMGRQSNNDAATVLDNQSQDNALDSSSISAALNKVIPGGYRTKLSFRTPLQQRGSNNSNFINYQNSLASESVERQRIRKLGLSSTSGAHK